MRKVSVFVVIAVFAISLAACGGSSSGGGGGGTGGTAMAGLATCTATSTTQGVVCGKATAADGTTPLIGAEVKLGTPSSSTSLSSITAKGVENPSQCVSDSSGDFACLVPEGQTGTLDFFISYTGYDDKQFNADITAGQTTDAGSQALTGSSAAKWVVVPGWYDGVQVLLSQLKGCTLTDGAGNPFDPATMDPASARGSDDCLSKGLLVLDDTDPTSQYFVTDFLTSTALSEYASLFVNCSADYSGTSGVDAAIQSFNSGGGHIYFSDLSDSWLTSAFPGMINFAGNSTSTGTISSSVPYVPLANVVGDPIDIVFDLGVWTAIDTVEAGVTTYIQGDLSTITSYTGVHPITVGWRPSSSTGCIFYTSYHIEGAGTGTGTPQENAIKYLVQNIGSVCQ